MYSYIYISLSLFGVSHGRECRANVWQKTKQICGVPPFLKPSRDILQQHFPHWCLACARGNEHKRNNPQHQNIRQLLRKGNNYLIFFPGVRKSCPDLQPNKCRNVRHLFGNLWKLNKYLTFRKTKQDDAKCWVVNVKNPIATAKRARKLIFLISRSGRIYAKRPWYLIALFRAKIGSEGKAMKCYQLPSKVELRFLEKTLRNKRLIYVQHVCTKHFLYVDSCVSIYLYMRSCCVGALVHLRRPCSLLRRAGKNLPHGSLSTQRPPLWPYLS